MTKLRKSRNQEPMEVDEPPAEGDHQENVEIDHISDDEEGGVRIGDIYIPPAPKPALTMEATGPRLIITNIDIMNFKSYAGKETLGPFHKSFTSIIGPNGSGKSNVIDSMLFVFGYRAAKIRSKKISVLIHSSSKHGTFNYASVEVHFALIVDKEGDSYTVIPNSEIIVARTVYKDNTSFYTLNGKKVQFKEVAKMLRSHNIDLDHNRFLILQGEVEQIAMMKPKGQTEHDTGMLEYLEDIIGTSRYKEPIEKLNIRVEELTEARKDKLNRVRLVEAEKQKLEGPMKEAVEHLNLSNAIVRARSSLLQKYVYETNKMIATKNEESNKLQEELDKIDERLGEIRTHLVERQNVLNEGNKKYDDLNQKKDECIDTLQQNKRKLVTVQSDLTQGNKKIKNLDDLLKAEKAKLIDLELIPEKNKFEIQECKTLLLKLDKEKKDAEEELQTVMSTLRSKTKDLQEKKDKIQSKLIILKKDVDEKTNAYKLAESELKIYLSNETSEQDKLEKLKQSLDHTVNSLNVKNKEYADLETKVPSAQKELAVLKPKLEVLKAEEKSMTAESRALRSQVEESKAAMTANRSKGRVLDSLMKQKRDGHLPGIFGRLGDLGAIDSRYDVAISTCCGALDNIVVDTIDTAQLCVDYLRRNNVGRATFIALDKQEHLINACQSKIDTPEHVARLFDLVKVKDQRVLPAFYYALRDTLVAKDLDQATRIAYGRTRYRVVTLGGDVIEIAGTMSGGGKSVMRGRMSSSVQQDTSINQSDIEEKERKLEILQNKLSEVCREQNTLEEKITVLSNTATQGKLQLDKLKLELKSLKEQIPLLKKQVQDQEIRAHSCKVDPAQKALHEEKVQEAKVILDEALEKSRVIEEEVSDVNREIKAVAGGKVKELQKNVKNVTTHIDKVKSEITRLEVAIKTSARNAVKSKEKITQMETDLQETHKKLESFNTEKKTLTIQTSELQKQVENIEEQISEGSNEFKDLKDEIAKIHSKENKVKSHRLELLNDKQKLEKIIEEFKSKIPVWDRELSTLKLEEANIEGIPGIERTEPLTVHTSEDLENFTVDELRHNVQVQKSRMGDVRPNIQAIQEYKAKEDMYLRRAAELDEITNKRNEMRSLYEQLRKKRTTDFLAGFNTITAKLKEMYQMITLGGDAELELVDSLDPFTEGIIFSVRPPNKSWKNISNLSGGEKTLSSLALVFALHYYRPTPLYVMDEIDAALDFKNVSIVANYIKERTKNAQFIIISLRSNMFEMSDRLVGICKVQDCTCSVTINNTPQL